MCPNWPEARIMLMATISKRKRTKAYDSRVGVFFYIEAKSTRSIVKQLFSEQSEHLSLKNVKYRSDAKQVNRKWWILRSEANLFVTEKIIFEAKRICCLQEFDISNQSEASQCKTVNPTKQICGCAISGTYFRTAHLSLHYREEFLSNTAENRVNTSWPATVCRTDIW